MKVVSLEYVSGVIGPNGLVMTLKTKEFVALPVGASVAVIVPEQGDNGMLVADIEAAIKKITAS